MVDVSPLIPVITIDGPSASGKGTVSRLIAQRLGWHLLDSGALYRLTGLAARRAGISLADETALQFVAESLVIEFRAGTEGTAIFLDGVEVTQEIRTEESSQAASKIAVLPSVRLALLARQRAFRQPPGLVADGRDMGTIVFPEAQLKIFITATAEERAKRRFKQLKELGISGNLADLLTELRERDARDQQRTTSPLVPAKESVLIDTTHKNIEQVVEMISIRWESVVGSTKNC